MKGWVKNLPSGDVELLAQGNQTQIDELIAGLSEKFESSVKEVFIQDIPTEEYFKNFSVRYDNR